MLKFAEDLKDGQITQSADLLVHYHLRHTNDTMTRLKGVDADIYIVSDPKWREKLREFTAEIFEVPC